MTNIGWDPLRVDLLWDLRQRPTRGPKPGLTVEQIARAGVGIADREGLKAVSMKRLATELGVGTMSLYTYLPDKASLLEVMLDFAFVEVGPTGNSWREVFESGAHAILGAYERHPWALEIFIGGPPIGPNQIRFLETCLAALEDTKLEEEEKLDAVMTVGSYARGSAHLSVGLEQAARSSGLDDVQLQEAYGGAYARILDPERFPHTAALLGGNDWESSTDRVEDFGFSWGLRRLLDGIESLIASRF